MRFSHYKLLVGQPFIRAEADGWFEGGLYPGERPPTHTGVYYLFNLTADPTERAPLDPASHADVLTMGLDLIDVYLASEYQEPQSNRLHPAALPSLHGGCWKPWE